jgi:pimeloyl-ACP methyl ester carboxylesterase
VFVAIVSEFPERAAWNTAPMALSQPVDGFRLAYDRHGDGPPVVLLHGWPGLRSDQAEVARLLATDADVVVPDLRGFGESFDPDNANAPLEAFAGEGQAASVLGLIDELGLERPVIAGYDIGSRVAQAIAKATPDNVSALVLAPPVSGVGDRVLTVDAQREFWYQTFHRLPLSEKLIDGDERAVRTYLTHFWDHWSAPGWSPPQQMFDSVVAAYARPGAFTASLSWYRAGAGTVVKALAERTPALDDRIAAPTTILWPEHDPLFPFEWSDRIDEFFADADLRQLRGVGHFTPLEAADAIAAAIRERLGVASPK